MDQIRSVRYPFSQALRLVIGSGCVAVLSVSGSAVVAAQGSTETKLAAHRAVYDITLERAATSSGIVELRGRMVYELKGSHCAGFEQQMRFVTQTVDRTGKPSIMDMRSFFREKADGMSFHFSTEQLRDKKLIESAVGDAKRGADGDNLSIKLKKPKSRKIDIDRPVVFPVQHSIELLEAAKAGKSIYSSDLYDGSEKGTKYYKTTAVVGKLNPLNLNTTLPKAKSAAALDGMKSWPVALSYFDPTKGKGDELPSYELSFHFFENGVSRSLIIDYGHFAIRGRLSSLSMLKSKPCKS